MTFPCRAFVFTLFLRVLCSAFAWRFGQAVGPNLSLATHHYSREFSGGPVDGWRYLLYGTWERFDTVWYLDIASNGYAKPGATVFYPLYPFLIHCITWLTREATVAALLISTVATFFVLWGIQKLANLDWPGRETTVVIVFVTFPSAFIFMAAYPEPLLIGLVVWCIYFARTDRWWLACALAFFAGLTKATGVMVAIPLGVLLIQERKWQKLPALAIAPLGFVAFAVWTRWSAFPSADVVYATYWRTRVTLPWQTLWDAFTAVIRDGQWIVAIDLTAFLFCFATVTLAKGWRLDYRLFSIACLILFLTKHTQPVMQSTVRYVLLLFPVFLYSARWFERRTALLVALLVLWPVYLAMLRTFLWWGLIA